MRALNRLDAERPYHITWRSYLPKPCNSARPIEPAHYKFPSHRRPQIFIIVWAIEAPKHFHLRLWFWNRPITLQEFVVMQSRLFSCRHLQDGFTFVQTRWTFVNEISSVFAAIHLIYLPLKVDVWPSVQSVEVSIQGFWVTEYDSQLQQTKDIKIGTVNSPAWHSLSREYRGLWACDCTLILVVTRNYRNPYKQSPGVNDHGSRTQ